MKAHNQQPGNLARLRLAAQLFNGHGHSGESVRVSEIAAKCQLDEESILRVLREFQTLGMVTLSGNVSVVFHAPTTKEMLQAYEIRAALEEIAGRAAAPALKGNTATLQQELDAMRASFRRLDLDSFVEHDVAFHRIILQASRNEILLRMWDSLAMDLRIRGAIGKVSKDLPEIVESHQPIIDALDRGRGREAGLLLRNHVETLLEFLKRSETDSGLQRALRRDLEGAKDVQQAFFPPRNLSIPCISCETFYQPAYGIGGDYYDFISLPNGRWGIAIGDVSGKGIGAALLMASLQASLRAQALHPHLDLSTLIGDVNRLVHDSSPDHFFASLFYAEYEPSTRILRYVNAGHNPPLVDSAASGIMRASPSAFHRNPGGNLAQFRISGHHFSARGRRRSCRLYGRNHRGGEWRGRTVGNATTREFVAFGLVRRFDAGANHRMHSG